MSIGIGIIGAGVMGADHARIVARQVASAHLVAISDTDGVRAKAVAGETGAHRAVDDPHGVINDPEVGAILIASPDQTHAGFTLACLAAGKPVLCEKPLAPTAGECLKVIAAETALGKRLIQVGFMRRFDPAYGAMKAALLSGSLGEALILHCVHRNVSSPSYFNAEMSIGASCVHEIDISRWLLSAEIVRVQVFKPRSTRASTFGDPMLVVFETGEGHLIDVELFLNASYGYDIKGELVCEKGTVSLSPPVLSEIRSRGVGSFSLAPDWRPRFADAYRIQLQEWVNGIATGKPVGASAWDGYVASAVAEAGIQPLKSGKMVNVGFERRPPLYD